MTAQALYKKDYQVEVDHIDFKNNLKLSSLFTYFQDISGLHSENLNMGREVLYDQYGVIWVLVRMRVEIIAYPKWNDLITIETWPQKPSRIGFDRDFLVRDREGNIMARAVSTWVVIDIESRKFKNPRSIQAEYPPVIEERAIDCRLGGLKPSGELELAYTRPVRYSDIDINRHLNNTKYLDFIMDSFSLEDHENHRVKSLEINYSQEALPGTSLSIYTDRRDIKSGRIYMEGLDEKENLIFKSQMVIEKTKPLK